ncbi:hypothetical protein PPYR_11752 [Photinus pyralis]|uniref:SGNH domain-containing protein n=2 Tax=Photinus pyralis TaxID=7054 RepID=A0A5N4AC52_PHOPY|nr:PC-esterase domain-containing protein 1A-like [Photinus pyralis]XP_031351790.1 PC-esterase domain-containing protein 1A-like [Photinus pyralis]XP_031351791.1 PC-esterase domain-containing protein 1A-like [Photinus pyralis]KAB0794913.1 hypothetical protein PPYR_11752 [Photinus pyralis]
MASDIFSSEKAKKLLQGKFIYFFGDSNTRAIYKDLLWLLEDGRLIPDDRLKRKNEESHANDIRTSNGKLHNGCDYDERREYLESCIIKFQFITKLYHPALVAKINNLSIQPDVIVINSCVWDLTRWGSTDSVEQFKSNVHDTFKLFNTLLPSTRIIWIATLPPAFKSKGGFLTKDIEFMRNMLPWHIAYANQYVANIAKSFSIDYLDMHYYCKFLLNYHTRDGIHWEPPAVRYMTNLLLTHICLSWNQTLPGVISLDSKFFLKSQFINPQSQKKPQPFRNISNNRNNFKAARNTKNKRKRKNVHIQGMYSF